MSKNIEMDGNPDDLITASEVAEIWNRRAEFMGYQKKYTRRSVNVRRNYQGEKANVLVPAQITPLGNLYKREDAWKFPIRPDLGRKVKEKHEQLNTNRGSSDLADAA